MTETLCLSGAVMFKAGANVSTAITAAQYTQIINQAESYINASTEKDWVADYASLEDDRKKILEDAASCHAAIAAINYDPDQYTNPINNINTLWARLADLIKILNEKDKGQAFVEGD